MNFTDESIRLMREFGEIKWCPLEGSKIVDFYKSKSVLVTGATGFLGKLLVEKLLRACPDINTIFILVRPKRGEDERTRINKIYTDKIYSVLEKILPNFQDKIALIKGDMCQPSLAISAEDKEIILEKVNVIFHVAATVRFDEKISMATLINVRGTRDLLNIARECKNLKSFVYVSTAYSNCPRKKIDEIFYTIPIAPDNLINLVENVPEEILIQITQKLIGDWPNTYAFTKAVAEDVVRNYSKDLPVCLVRPSIVVATYKEPLRSWTDNFYGFTGVVIGSGLGILKSIHCKENLECDLVPADYVINNMIAASYNTTVSEHKGENVIYNCMPSMKNRQTWEEVMKTSYKWGIDFPSVNCIWYYSLTFNRYKIIHHIYSILFHFLPAVIMDLGMTLTGLNKPMMSKIYKKISKFESVISYFTMREWNFCNDNTQALLKNLTESDQKMFPFDMENLDWEDYHKTHILGVRTHLLKEDLSTLPQARRKWKIFYFCHMIVKTILYLIIFYILYSILSVLFG